MAKEPIISRMSVAGHPIHPMVIHFPVAFLLGLVGTDLAYFFLADPFWARAGLWLAGIGSLGGWLAGLAGLVDLVFVPRIRQSDHRLEPCADGGHDVVSGFVQLAAAL